MNISNLRVSTSEMHLTTWWKSWWRFWFDV